MGQWCEPSIYDPAVLGKVTSGGQKLLRSGLDLPLKVWPREAAEFFDVDSDRTQAGSLVYAYEIERAIWDRDQWEVLSVGETLDGLVSTLVQVVVGTAFVFALNDNDMDSERFALRTVSQVTLR